jgi:hypothetical protein
MSELDQEMSAILKIMDFKNPRLSIKEKLEMYNEVLRRNLIFESRLLRKPQGSQENINHNFVLNESVGNKSMNSSETKNTSFDSDASLSFNNPKKEEKRDVKDEDKEAVQKVKTEFDGPTIRGKKGKNLKANLTRFEINEGANDDDNDDNDDDDDGEEKQKFSKLLKWESTPAFGRYRREKKIKHDYYESASSLQASLDRKKRKLKKQKKILLA